MKCYILSKSHIYIIYIDILPGDYINCTPNAVFFLSLESIDDLSAANWSISPKKRCFAIQLTTEKMELVFGEWKIIDGKVVARLICH